MRASSLIIALIVAALTAGSAAADEVRAVWVTRYDYKSAADVKAIIKGCAELGANRVIFQVRGQADAFYASKLEPWSAELGGRDPGFDPLDLAVREAKARGLALEAWINVMPLWKGRAPPEDPKHLLRAHPEWRVVGSDGAPQRLNEHYVCANPALLAVRKHLAAVAADLAGRYAFDALHLDYIRYVTDLERKLDYSHDPASLAAFKGDPKAEAARWRRFKAAQVTATVRAIRAAVKEARPGCRLTAAVFPTAASRARVFQDAEGWAREGLVDAVYPMLYSAEDDEFRARLKENLERFAAARPGLPVVSGIGVYKHRQAERSQAQIEAARRLGAAGVALFCYASFFETRDRQELQETRADLRSQRRAAIARLFTPAPAGAREGKD